MAPESFQRLIKRKAVNMFSRTVSPADIKIPESNDFVSIFGCEHSVDSDLFEKYHFQDNYGATAILTFGHVDNSFGLTLCQEGFEVVIIYDEFLKEASIDENNQSVLITLKQGDKEQRIRLIVWPRFSLSIERMR